MRDSASQELESREPLLYLEFNKPNKHLKSGIYSSAAFIANLVTTTVNLLCHLNVPIELSRLLNNFLRAKTENNLFARVTGKRKREIGLVVPARLSAVTTELHIAEVSQRELSSKAMKYSHFELNNITIEKNKFPRLV